MQFVNDVFNAIKSKSYLSINSTLIGGGLRLSTPTQENTATYSPPPAKSQSPVSSRRTRSPDQPRYNPKKRSHGYIDRDAPPVEQERNYAPRSRGAKAPRRGGSGRGDGKFDGNSRWSRGGGEFGNDRGQKNYLSATQQTFPADLPLISPGGTMPAMSLPGMPWGNDPMSQFLAAQAAVAAAAIGGWPMLPFPMPVSKSQLPPLNTSVQGKRRLSNSSDSKKVAKRLGQRCKDYDEKGYCMQGDACPYEHGQDHLVVAADEDEGTESADLIYGLTLANLFRI